MMVTHLKVYFLKGLIAITAKRKGPGEGDGEEIGPTLVRKVIPKNGILETDLGQFTVDRTKYGQTLQLVMQITSGESDPAIWSRLHI